jgi:hypothetical protein
MFYVEEDRIRRAIRRLSIQALWATAFLAWAAAARGQVVSPNAGAAATGAAEQPPAANAYQGEYFTTDLTEVFRLRHMEGDGQGDVPAFTNFGFTKFVWGPQGVLMFDAGARITNEGEPGFTVGVHRRVVSGDVVLGAGLFFDEQDFHQGSVAFELFTPNWAFRTNGYAILGEDVEEESEYSATGATAIGFQGNNIVATNLLLEEFYEVAMSGMDFEVARYIAGFSSEAFVGGYFYDGEEGEHVSGAKGGVRGFLLPDLAATLMVSGDDVFGTNVFGGITWFVGARGGLSRPHVARRLTIPVERNEQIVVNEVEERELVPGPVVLTYDDEAIEVVHVEAGAAGANVGTFEDPFSALPATQDADIVYVHADGVFLAQSYTMAVDQRLLGEGSGNLHLVETDELGDIVLPAGNAGVARPLIQSATGNAITLNEGTEVSNFAIDDAAGHGIVGDGISDFDVNRNVVTGSAGSGIFLNNVVEPDPLELVASGEITGNTANDNEAANIRLVLLSDFEGDVAGNTANDSGTAEGILIEGGVRFFGDVSGNTATNNDADGIVVAVDEFFGDIEDNTSNTNGGSGLLLAFDVFDGDVESNTTNANAVRGIDLSIVGSGLSEVEIADNTASGNLAEGIALLFSGTGTSLVEVLDNSLAGNNGGAAREFFAQNEDALDVEPTVYIRLDGNTSTNVVAAPAFNYEFENEDIFDGDGEMTVDLGTNVGTVEDDDDVEFGDFP